MRPGAGVDYGLAVARSFTDEVDELIRSLVADRDAALAEVDQLRAMRIDVMAENRLLGDERDAALAVIARVQAIPTANDEWNEFYKMGYDKALMRVDAALTAVPTEPTGGQQ